MGYEPSEVESLKNQITWLQMMLKKSEKDAARYRWLRLNSTQPQEPWSTHKNPESLDMIIDEAMAKIS